MNRESWHDLWRTVPPAARRLHHMMTASRLLAVTTLALAACVALGVTRMPAAPVVLTRSGHPDRIEPTSSAPTLSVLRVGRWTSAALTRILSFSFVDAETHIQAMRHLFAPAGWASMSVALTDSGLLRRVVDNKLQVVLVPEQAPRLVNSSRQGGSRIWVLQMPVLMVYRGPGSPRAQRLIAQVIVVSLPPRVAPQGLGILQINFKTEE